MDEKIPIHWLHNQAYCEYQIYLEIIKGIVPETSAEVQRGVEAHAALDQSHEEKAEIELSVKDALTKAKSEQIFLISRGIFVEGTRLIGLIDEVLFTPSEIHIIDDKPGDVPYITNKRQLWGYCLAFEEQFRPNMPIVAVLRNRDTGNEIWAEPFKQEHREDVLDAVTRIIGILNGTRPPIPTKKPTKCRACRYRVSCDAKTE